MRALDGSCTDHASIGTRNDPGKCILIGPDEGGFTVACFALGWRLRLFQVEIAISAFTNAGTLEPLQSFVPAVSSDTASAIVSGARGFWGVFIAISAAKCRQSHHSLKADLSSSASPWRARIAPTQHLCPLQNELRIRRWPVRQTPSRRQKPHSRSDAKTVELGQAD